MNNRIFNRYERKYIMDMTTMEDFIPFLRQYLTHDPYSQNGHHYTIYNIYFDTDDFGIVRNSIQKPPYKEKTSFANLRFSYPPRQHMLS